jgi:hypothetical protein
MQSNKQSNLSFYQNSTDIQNNSESVTNTKTISTKDLVNNSKVLKRSRRLEILRKYNFHLVKTNKISFNHFKKGVDSLKKLVENNWDKFVAVTPIITENTKVTPQIENETQTIDNQIQVAQTQINRLTKLNSFATLLQKKSNKKSFYKYRQILLSIRNKTDLKQRVLNLLVWEHERLEVA